MLVSCDKHADAYINWQGCCSSGTDVHSAVGTSRAAADHAECLPLQSDVLQQKSDQGVLCLQLMLPAPVSQARAARQQHRHLQPHLHSPAAARSGQAPI